MCMIDGADSDAQVQHAYTVKKSRKPCKCTECRREIPVGDTYYRVEMVMEGGWHTFRVCTHCQVATEWLRKECGGYLLEGVLEDISEHVQEYRSMPLAKILVGMKRKWRALRGDGLMPLPEMPPFTHVEEARGT